MSLLKKLFMEEIPLEESEMLESDASTYDLPTEIEVELSNVNTATLIEDIYLQNDLSDKTKSIFKVEELINSLPKEMVTETKKASVLAILGSFGLTTTDVGLDGENRIDVLSGILSKIKSDSNKEITDNEVNIEAHKKAIADLEKMISDKQNEIKLSESSINSEITRVSELIKFIGGVV